MNNWQGQGPGRRPPAAEQKGFDGASAIMIRLKNLSMEKGRVRRINVERWRWLSCPSVGARTKRLDRTGLYQKQFEAAIMRKS